MSLLIKYSIEELAEDIRKYGGTGMESSLEKLKDRCINAENSLETLEDLIMNGLPDEKRNARDWIYGSDYEEVTHSRLIRTFEALQKAVTKK